MTIATAASLMTFTLEFLLHKELVKRLVDNPGAGSKSLRAVDAEEGPEGDCPKAISNVAAENEVQCQAGLRRASDRCSRASTRWQAHSWTQAHRSCMLPSNHLHHAPLAALCAAPACVQLHGSSGCHVPAPIVFSNAGSTACLPARPSRRQPLKSRARPGPATVSIGRGNAGTGADAMRLRPGSREPWTCTPTAAS